MTARLNTALQNTGQSRLSNVYISRHISPAVQRPKKPQDKPLECPSRNDLRHCGTEGQYFARQHYEAGYRLEDYLDLESYMHGDETACQYGDHPGCYEVAYYSTWLGLYHEDFADLMAGEGVFRADASGSTVTVESYVPRFPMGAHGFRAAVAYFPAGKPAAAVEVPIACAESDCSETVLRKLAAGDYECELRVYNNHPEVMLVDYETNEEYPFGNYLFQVVPLAKPITIAGLPEEKTRRWFPWRGWWRSRMLRLYVFSGNLEAERTKGVAGGLAPSKTGRLSRRGK